MYIVVKKSYIASFFQTYALRVSNPLNEISRTTMRASTAHTSARVKRFQIKLSHTHPRNNTKSFTVPYKNKIFMYIIYLKTSEERSRSRLQRQSARKLSKARGI